MNDGIGPDRQQLLADLLCGDRRLDDPAVGAYLAKDPSLRVEFEELSALKARIGAVASRERELLSAALAVEDRRPYEPKLVPAERADAASIPHRAGRGSKVSGSKVWGPKLWLGLAAAAAVVVAGSLWWPDAVPSHRDDQRVLSGQAVVLHEEVLRDGSRRFTWESTLRGATFEAMVYDPAVGQGKPLAEREAGLENQTEWTLEPGLAGQVRTGFRLRVVTFAGGREKPFELSLQ